MHERIKCAEIVERLQGHILGELEMSNSQVQAARILLGKVLPDREATESTVEISSKPVRKMTNDELRDEITRCSALLQSPAGGVGAESGEEKPDSLH